MSSIKQASPQLELFSAMNFVVVDPRINNLVPVVEEHINDASTMQRFALLHPDTVYEHSDRIKPEPKQLQTWNFFGIEVFVAHPRINGFRANMACVGCGCVGNAYLVERHVNDGPNQYLNLYCIERGSIKLMTVDHILPDSLGGRYVTSNFQTMCRACNLAKRNMMSLADIALVRAQPELYAKSWMHMPFLMALLDVQALIQQTTGKRKASLIKVFDVHRRRVKFGTTKPAAIVATNALLKAIEESNLTFAPAPPVAVGNAWVATIKRWYALLARILDRACRFGKGTVAEPVETR